MTKSWKLACNMVNSNNTINSLPKVQISLGIVTLFEKIYDGGPILHYADVWKQLMISNDISKVR
jgi:hypothetical protein